jgi:hypothetical protein
MKLSAPPRISGLNGREVYDSQGQLAVQAEVMCTIRNEQKVGLQLFQLLLNPGKNNNVFSSQMVLSLMNITFKM